MSFLTLKNAVIRLSPNQISTTLAGEVVNAAYARVIRARNWTSSHSYQVLTFEAPYTTGTVTTVRGSTTVTGLGTTWVAAHVDRMFQVGQSVPIRITAVGSTTALTLAQAWGDAAVSGSPYAILDNRFSLGSNVERILSLASKHHVLERKDLSFINTADPSRLLRATPRFFAEFEVRAPGTSTQRREIEVWPVPHEVMQLGLWYKTLPPDMSADGDVASIPETLIEYSAQAEASRILFSRTGDANWLQVAQVYEANFKEALMAYTSEDMISQDEPMPAPGAP